MMNTLTPQNGMMNGPFAGITYGYHIHFVFGILLLVGIILLVIWAAKNLNSQKLYKLTITLLIIGLLGWLITAPMSRFCGGWGGSGLMMGGGIIGHGFGMMHQNMVDCMQDEACHEEMGTFMHKVMSIENHDQ